MHKKDATGNASPQSKDPLAVAEGRISDPLAKKGAERAKTLKPYFEAHFGDAQFSTAKQLLCPFDPPLNEILVRRSTEGVAKEPQEMIAREKGLTRDLIQAEREIIELVDEFARSV